MENSRGRIAGLMVSILVMLVATPLATSASAIPMFSTGYSTPPDYPVASNVVISPSHPVVGDEISCSYDFYDQSGDPDHSTISWQLINTTGGYFIANGSSIETSNFEANSVIECYVTAFDGTSNGNTARNQILLGDNISRSLPDLIPSIIYMRDNQSSLSDLVYDGDVIEMSHQEEFEWNISLMKLNQNKDFRIIAYISNESTGILSLSSQHITATNQNQTISLGKLSFEYDDGCYVATIMIYQLEKPGIYKDSFNFVLDVGGNDCAPYVQEGKYNPDCVTCPKVSWAYIYTTNTLNQNFEVKTTGLYPGKEYSLDVVVINETTPSIVFADSYDWNTNYGAKRITHYDLNLSVGDYCIIASLYEDGEWINSVRSCITIEEPEPPRIQFLSIRYNDYLINHYVETSVRNMVFGKSYTLNVELVNNSTGYVIMSENDTINASYLNWWHYMGDANLTVGYYCAKAILYEDGVFIDEYTGCRHVVERNATIVSNGIRYNEYTMDYWTYSKVSYLTPGENYQFVLTLSNMDNGNNIIVETHDWVATYGAKAFRINDIDLPIGEFCLTAVLYENGTEVDRRVSCRMVICQYDTHSMGVDTNAQEEEDSEPSFIDNVLEAIVEAISDIITDIFAEAKDESDEDPENQETEIVDSEAPSTD
ncbi:MAG: hypothetical protein ACJZ4V_03050 [Candidatus Poseidoniaceae archaeon]